MAVDIAHVLHTICTVESGCNYKAQNPHSTASGAYQFTDATWARYGGYTHAKDAPPAVQDAKATSYVKRILLVHGSSVWWVPAIWYAGWSGASTHPWSYKPQGGQAISEYVNHWLGVGGYQWRVDGGMGGVPVTQGPNPPPLPPPQPCGPGNTCPPGFLPKVRGGVCICDPTQGAIDSIGAADPSCGDTCIHSWSLNLIVAHPCICFDTILGGLKIVAGAWVLMVAGLAILYLIGKELGAPAVVGKAVKTTAKLTPPGRAYSAAKGVGSQRSKVRRTVKVEGARRSTEQARAATVRARSEARESGAARAAAERRRAAARRGAASRRATERGAERAYHASVRRGDIETPQRSAAGRRRAVNSMEAT